ncbi:MAG: hypothetical protein QF752_07210 [Planctomycetota bacterium]|jgi:hypothetical protein|nr:hypothetical protein [Planctomycetota bacterium]
MWNRIFPLVSLALLTLLTPVSAQDSKSRYIGSLNPTIKSDSDSSTDLERTIATLKKTGQNLYGPEADELEDFAMATDGEGIDLVPLYTKYNIESEWSLDFEALASHLSSLGSTYSNLVAFSVDDFHRYVNTSEGDGSLAQLTPEDVQAISDAAASDSGLEFWPLIGVYQSPVLLAESHSLGARWGTAFESTDHCTMRMSFEGSATLHRPTPNDRILFSFLWIDSLQATSLESSDWQGVFFLKVFVNGTEIACKDLYELTPDGEPGHKRVRLISSRIHHLIHGGLNEIEIQLTATQKLNAYQLKMAHLWDFSLSINGKEMLQKLSPTITYETSSTDLIAASNEAYRITDSIGGAMTYLATHPSMYPGNRVYRRYLQSMKRALGKDKTFIMCQTCKVGYDWESVGEVDPERLAQQTDLSIQYADGVVTWNLPISLDYLPTEEGLFAEKSPKSGFDLRAYWPSSQAGLHDWTQRWSATLSGSISISLQDSYTSSSSARFRKRIYSRTTGEVFYEDTENYNESQDAEDDAILSESATRTQNETDGLEEITIDLGETDQEIVIEFTLIDSIGDMKVTLDILGPTGASWNYEADIEDNLLQCYRAIVTKYREHARRPVR